MDVALFLFLALVGLSVGFLSGLLGIGGGIVMFPLLLYVPPLLGPWQHRRQEHHRPHDGPGFFFRAHSDVHLS